MLDATGCWKPALCQLPVLTKGSVAVEQFRRLRNRMEEKRKEMPLKSIAIASATSSEGESFVAANLAISLARRSRVVVVDGDMRRGGLQALFGCAAGPGLAEYLRGENTLAEVVQSGSHYEHCPSFPRGLTALAVIVGGLDTEAATDLTETSRLGELITALSEWYDWVIVDTPPVNLLPDGVNIANLCDGTLVVARSGMTKYESAQQAIMTLKLARVVGAVLNAVEKLTFGGSGYAY